MLDQSETGTDCRTNLHSWTGLQVLALVCGADQSGTCLGLANACS